jgi:hypothetical protein
MLDFPIDPELRVRASPEQLLRRTKEAQSFVRAMTLSRPQGRWREVLQSFEAIRDEWSAIEAVVNLELLLEAEGLLIEAREQAEAAKASLALLGRIPAPSAREDDGVAGNG